MNIGLGLIAVAGLIAALLVHGLTYVSVDAAARFPAVWGLHLASILIMVPVIWHLRSTVGSRLRLADIRALLPPWAAGLCVAAMIYTFANFALGLKNTEGGSVSVKDGHFVLQSHGRLIRTLTAPEYCPAEALRHTHVLRPLGVLLPHPCALFLDPKPIGYR